MEHGPEFDIELKLLLEGIYLRYQQDFRHYAVASMRRRVQQAMARFECDTVSSLQARVLHEPAVFAELMRFLTVQVSDLFRDPEYFAALRAQVMPVMRTYPSLKVWVAGCSTGEEVWSLAILLEEEGLLERTILYATDINAEALRAAEAGIFRLADMARFSANYQAAGGKRSLSDYYQAGYDRAIFRQSLKTQIVFADHSLATDSVFSEVHLVSCRNVLIYFDRALQNRALKLFYDSLVHRGFLGIGPKETLRFSAQAHAFSELAPGLRIYQRI